MANSEQKVKTGKLETLNTKADVFFLKGSLKFKVN